MIAKQPREGKKEYDNIWCRIPLELGDVSEIFVYGVVAKWMEGNVCFI